VTRHTAFIDSLSGVPPRRQGRRGSTTAQRADLLSRVPLFSGLSRRHIKHLAEAATDAMYRPGTTIVLEGKPGDTFFVIVDGEADVLRGVRRIARLGAGDFFGEIALLDGGPRTATVEARTPVLAMRLGRATFNQMLKVEPKVGVKILDEVAHRIREREKLLTA
jgi:CRP/FNR family transcriptional regulator, cyclic AMP receptor protein